MRGIATIMLACALALLAIHAPARAATSDAADLHALYALSSGIHDALAVDNNTALASKAYAERVRHQRTVFDALTRRAATAETDGVLRGKLRALLPLLGTLERRLAAGPASAISDPSAHRAGARATLSIERTQFASQCAHALSLQPGYEIGAMLAAGAELWVRAGPSSKPLRVSTAASALDTEIAVFDQCPTGTGAAEHVAYDNVGLAAVLGLAPSTQSRWLRVRNLGERGEVSVTMEENGFINGRVTLATDGSPIYFIQVTAVDAQGGYVQNAMSETDGTYQLALAPGSYYVTATSTRYVGQLWRQVDCPTGFGFPPCPFDQGTQVNVVAGGTVDQIDFALTVGARIDGHVHDAQTGLAVRDAYIELWNASGDNVDSTYSDSNGRYQFTALSAGTYYVSAAHDSYRGRLFRGVDCGLAQCPILSGTPIALSREGTFVADMLLSPSLYANVTVRLDPALDPGRASFVNAYDTTGQIIAWAPVFDQKPARIGPLEAGRYYFSAQANNYVSQLYSHFDCTTDCHDQLASGTSVTVADGAPAPNLAFDLHAKAHVSGRITDAPTQAGLADATVSLWSLSLGYAVAWSYVPLIDGHYELAGIDPGDYWLIVRSPTHRDTVYANAPCDDFYQDLDHCDASLMQAIHVDTHDVSGIDVALPMNGSIMGSVRYRSPPDVVFPVYSGAVSVYTPTGNAAQGYGYIDATSTYRVDDLVPGTYLAVESTDSAYPQIYAHIDCTAADRTCPVTSGTPFDVNAGQVTSGIDFDIVGLRRIFGRVTDAASGIAIPGVAIDSWDIASDAHCDADTTDAAGYYAIGDHDTCYSTAVRLSTDARPGHVDQVYSNIECPLGPVYLGQCSLDGATAVAYASGPQLVRADLALERSDAVFADGFDGATARLR